MNQHEHGHAHDHGDPHHHGHAEQPHPPQRHAHDHDHGGSVGPARPGLLMTSSVNRVLGALVLIALLWLAVSWAVLFVD
jgi:hypothetical protein